MRQLLRGAGARDAANNLGWLVIEKLARLALGVFVGFVVARHLGPAKFGALSYALAVVAIGSAVAEAGVSAIVRREIAGATPRADGALRAAWVLRLLAGAVCYLVVLVWAAWGEPGASERTLLAILGLLLFQPALAVSDLWLQARLRARSATCAQLVALGAGAAIRLGLVLAAAPLWSFAVAAVAEAAVAVSLLQRFARAAGRPAAASLPDGLRSGIVQLWAESWPLLASGLAVMLYIRIDLIMVRYMAGGAAAGTYAAAVRLSEIWFFLPGAVVSSLLPGLLRARSAGPVTYRGAVQRMMDVNAAIAYALAVPTVLLAPWIVRLAYGAAYADSGPILMVHGWTLVWAALGVGRGQYCVNEGLTRLHLLSTTAGALLNMALNYMLIPRFGGVGAAWATLAAQATATWATSFCFAPLRECGGLQTRALFVPVRGIGMVFPRT